MMLSLQRRFSASGPFREIFVAAGFALALLAPMHAEAEPHRFDRPREMYSLPGYCMYTQDYRDHIPGGNNPAQIERWTTIMGPTFIHMHHYCYGLMATNRAAFLSPTREDRVHNLGVSITEFDYVIERAPPDFGLLPEIFTRKGENLIQLERVGQGMAELQRAIDMKPDYWPAYGAISDYYKDAGQFAKAREWLEKGLAVAPDARALKRRLADLDVEQSRGTRRKNLQAPVER
ncbi:MAG: tetratricopeptide repeat protein [Burkholderiales bacterium]